MKKNHIDNHYRWEIAFRTLAAILGGYALANVSGILLSFLLPMPKSDAVMTGILLSFAIYTGAIMWVFAVRSVHKAWLGLTIPSLILGAIALVMKLSGATP